MQWVWSRDIKIQLQFEALPYNEPLLLTLLKPKGTWHRATPTQTFPQKYFPWASEFDGNRTHRPSSTGPDTEEDYQEDLLQQFYLYYSFTSFPFPLVNGNGGTESLPLPLQRKPHLWAASNGACWQTYGWSPGYVSNPVTVSLQLLLFFPLTIFFSENTFIQLEGWRQQQTVILSGSCSGRWYS